MAQSVELLLDDSAEAAVRHQWSLLADAGLPSERRTGADEHHRPHLTLFASGHISSTTEAVLSGLVAGLDLEVRLGGLLLFGPRRGRAILVRQVTPSVPLLELQTGVGSACGAERAGQFGPGRWTPHITLARRVPIEQLSEVVAALGRTADHPLSAQITRCRRWDGDHKTGWLI